MQQRCWEINACLSHSQTNMCNEHAEKSMLCRHALIIFFSSNSAIITIYKSLHWIFTKTQVLKVVFGCMRVEGRKKRWEENATFPLVFCLSRGKCRKERLFCGIRSLSLLFLNCLSIWEKTKWWAWSFPPFSPHHMNQTSKNWYPPPNSLHPFPFPPLSPTLDS